MADETVGTENLKKAAAFLVTLGTSIKNALADGKVDLVEIVSILPNLALIPALVESKDAIVNEAKNLSVKKVQDLESTYVGVGSESVTNTITNLLFVLVSVQSLYATFSTKKEIAPVQP